MTGIWHYGRALAFIYPGRPKEARRELRALIAAREMMGTVEHCIGYATAETLLMIVGDFLEDKFEASDPDELFF
jgi:hypothetical protein